MTAMNLRDDFGNPKVTAFVRGQMEPFDTTRLREFRLYVVRGSQHFAGCCQYPNRQTGRTHYRITAGATLSLTYPWATDIQIGTVTMPNGWRYVTKRFTFQNASEAIVYMAGHEAFHFLRHSRQVPGRNGEPSASRYGLGWVKAWREAE